MDIMCQKYESYLNPTPIPTEYFRVIVAGGREFNNYELLKSSCDRILIRQTNIEIVSGKALGADKLGEDYAKEKGYKIKEFPADWIKYKKGAGPIRNKQMAEYADELIAFWDGLSKGTKNMIELAKKHGLKIKVIYY